ncbi:LytR/AlgR family response regulator transcription factor [Flagellimonas flava]|uniref:Two component transcriptional regulator, LytTR family n=1 Tax=Flagellimonas flava TaxID=570519 RepID=A0A1M5HK61_9FLAO|nr:LytTR family DNA-binding domain-containing protein [Allomuricauda flava]SHG16288.1 two component transcriptional regulator, LytTR family [Allomuricauda flava]
MMAELKLKTVLVEDEGAALRRLKKFASNSEYLKVVGMAQNGLEAIQEIKSKSPDLILLDIELKDMTAFEVLDRLSCTFTGKIIFVTAFNKYAVNAFNISAIDYLLKPYDEHRFEQAIEKAVKQMVALDTNMLLEVFKKLNPNSPEKLQIQEGSTLHHIPIKEIIWIEADGYYCKLYKLNGKSVLLRKLLKEFEIILPKTNFKRINRSSIINTSFIEKERVHQSNHLYYLTGGFELKQSDKYMNKTDW